MRKTILLLTLLLSAMNGMAQAYEFETEEKSFDDGTKYIRCDTKKYVELDVSSPDINLILQDFYDENNIPFLGFALFKYARGQYKNSMPVVKKIRELAFQVPKGEKAKEHVSINLYLSNGDILYGIDRGQTHVSTRQRNFMEVLDSAGFVSAGMIVSFFKSTKIPREIQTEENQQIICQQLRTYDIVKIEVDGVSFDVRGLRSAATLDAMFNALAAKTGKGHLYRSSSTSSSSSTASSGPTAMCELGFVGVFSDGQISCRVDNLRISGAKGKDVKVGVLFEDVTDEFITYGFVEKLTSVPYDDTTYENVILRGHVSELERLNSYGRGRFKVHIEVVADNRVIYESNAKYITIYKDGGSWRYK